MSVTSSNGKLVEEEERTTGDVSASAYWTYFRAAGWGYFVLFFIASISARACELLMPFILSLWSDYNVAECQRLSPENVTFGRIDVQDCALPISEGTDNKTYLNWYGIAGGASVCFVAVGGLVTAAGRVRASRVLHEALIKSVLRAPMSFFDKLESKGGTFFHILARTKGLPLALSNGRQLLPSPLRYRE